jgi:hypothetical protein
MTKKESLLLRYVFSFSRCHISSLLIVKVLGSRGEAERAQELEVSAEKDRLKAAALAKAGALLSFIGCHLSHHHLSRKFETASAGSKERAPRSCGW